jgi:hypothetical protein
MGQKSQNTLGKYAPMVVESTNGPVRGSMGILALGLEVTYQTDLGGRQVQTPVKAFFCRPKSQKRLKWAILATKGSSRFYSVKMAFLGLSAA